MRLTHNITTIMTSQHCIALTIKLSMTTTRPNHCSSNIIPKQKAPRKSNPPRNRQNHQKGQDRSNHQKKQSNHSKSPQAKRNRRNRLTKRLNNQKRPNRRNDSDFVDSLSHCGSFHHHYARGRMTLYSGCVVLTNQQRVTRSDRPITMPDPAHHFVSHSLPWSTHTQRAIFHTHTHILPKEKKTGKY